jgi:pyridoxamine 5'-phosphate oxidase
MSLPTPSFYDDLGETLAEAWRLMARGVADRRSAFHHPALATAGADGAPEVRTVILRACDVAGRSLRFHTDQRSGKARELAANPRAALHFYDPGSKIQLRAAGRAALHANDAVADAAWAGSRPISRQVYGVMPGPGAEIASGGAFRMIDGEGAEDAPGRANFMAVVLEVQRLEWLYLAAAGHRRALFTWDGGTLRSAWLSP